MALPTLPSINPYDFFVKLNQTGDSVFYDVDGVSDTEKDILNNILITQGGLIVVKPAENGQIPNINVVLTVEGLEAYESETKTYISTVAVAGVGSSPLGTVALARDVANVTREPVIGVVTGYGLGNLLSEALGGYFWFHTHNVMNGIVDKLVSAYDHSVSIASMGHPEIIEAAKTLRRSIGVRRDSKILNKLLQKRIHNLKLLVGHSKGNFMIADALRAVAIPTDTVPGVKIVTLGAVVSLPEAYRQNVTQYLGGADLLGLINSTPYVEKKEIPGRAHSLNTRLPVMLPINAETVLKSEVVTG